MNYPVSKGIRVGTWDANEMLQDLDINFIGDSQYTNFVAAMLAHATGVTSSVDEVISGLSVVPDNLMTLTLEAGIAISATGTYLVDGTWGFTASAGDTFAVVVPVDTSVSILPADPTNPRIDVIQIRPTRVEYDEQSRQYKDPITGLVASAPTDTKVEYGFEFDVLKGTAAASPSAPSKTAGWIKLAEVHIAALQTTLTSSDILNVSDSASWNDDEGATVLLTSNNRSLLPGRVDTQSRTSGNWLWPTYTTGWYQIAKFTTIASATGTARFTVSGISNANVSGSMEIVASFTDTSVAKTINTCPIQITAITGEATALVTDARLACASGSGDGAFLEVYLTVPMSGSIRFNYQMGGNTANPQYIDPFQQIQGWELLDTAVASTGNTPSGSTASYITALGYTDVTELAGTGRTTETVKDNADQIADLAGAGRTTETVKDNADDIGDLVNYMVPVYGAPIEIPSTPYSIVGVSTGSSLTAMRHNLIACYDPVSDKLSALEFQGDALVLAGSALTMSVGASAYMTALSEDTIAFADTVTDTLRAYTFNGSAWSLTGSALSVTGMGISILAALNSTDIALMDSIIEELSLYRFNGSTWSKIGNGLSIPGVVAGGISALNDTDIAYHEYTNDKLATYRWDGVSDWNLVGTELTVPASIQLGLCALNSTDIVMKDNSTPAVRIYRWDGATWTELSGPWDLPGTAGGMCALNSQDVAVVDLTNDTVTVVRFGVTLTGLSPHGAVAGF